MNLLVQGSRGRSWFWTYV